MRLYAFSVLAMQQGDFHHFPGICKASDDIEARGKAIQGTMKKLAPPICNWTFSVSILDITDLLEAPPQTDAGNQKAPLE